MAKTNGENRKSLTLFMPEILIENRQTLKWHKKSTVLFIQNVLNPRNLVDTLKLKES